MRPLCSISRRSKRSYASQSAALRAAAGFSELGRAKGRTLINYDAYACSCGRWHLTKLDDRLLAEIRAGESA